MPFEPASDRVVGGKYRLIRRLAAGGMGSVWVARHETLDAEVAVKLMADRIASTASGAARFEREAKATAQLSSPHVVRVQDFGVEDGAAFMVLELLKGEDLAERLERTRRLSLAETTAIATALCKGLAVAHDAGLVHRDIKPRNIFLARQGDEEIVKLLDFGVARETTTRLVDEVTTTGLVLGSPSHMSPEQAASGDVDARSDLWSLGIVLYRCLTGRLPFDGANVPALVLAIVSAPLVPPSTIVAELGPAVDAFFVRALARNPAKRFQSAREMGKAFVALEAAPAPVAPVVVVEEPSASRGRDEETVSELGITGDAVAPPRSRWRWVGVAAAGAILLVGGGALALRDRAGSVDARTVAAAVAPSGTTTPVVPSAEPTPPEAGAPAATAVVTVAPSPSARGTTSTAALPSSSAPTANRPPVPRHAPTSSCTHFDSFTGHCLR